MIIIGSDHAGYTYKQMLITYLQAQNYSLNDVGTYSEESTDYPDYAHQVARVLVSTPDTLTKGILLCGSGNGVAITANKHPHIRAALCWDKEIAMLARKHNDANILCLPARFMSKESVRETVDTFLQTSFEGGRHERRVKKIDIS